MKVTLFVGTGALMASTAVATILGLSARRSSPPADESWWRSVQRFAADEDTVDYDYFGMCVALDGDWALIGAPLADAVARHSGTAYVFPNNHEGSDIKLGGEDSTAAGGFGWSVALCGPMVLVGKPGDDQFGTDSGAAILYRQDETGQWNRVTKLVADDATAYEDFGIRVALDQHVALVAAKTSNRAGAAYVFECDGRGSWRQCAKLVSDQQTSDVYFGSQLALDGDLAVVGASRERIGSDGQLGAVYVFQRAESTGWNRLAKLTTPDPNISQHFGRSVAVWNGAILVGAQGYSRDSGTAYLYREHHAGAWELAARLTPHDGPSTSFGSTVALSSRILAVGAPLVSNASGAVYLFLLDEEGSPQQIGRITLPGKPSDNWFGAALALNGDDLFVGAHKSGGRRPQSGAAYLFHLAPLNPISRVPAL